MVGYPGHEFFDIGDHRITQNGDLFSLKPEFLSQFEWFVQGTWDGFGYLILESLINDTAIVCDYVSTRLPSVTSPSTRSARSGQAVVKRLCLRLRSSQEKSVAAVRS